MIQMQDISFLSSGIRRNQNFETAQQSWLLLFAFSPSLFFRFSCLIFFSLAEQLVGFILVGKVVRKAFGIFGLDERKGIWVVKQNFHETFQVKTMLHGFLSFSSVSLTKSCSFWYGLKDLFTLHKLADKVILDHSNWWTRKDLDSYRRLWANRLRYRMFSLIRHNTFFNESLLDGSKKSVAILACVL